MLWFYDINNIVNMPYKCFLTKKKNTLIGNNVSYSNTKTKRKFSLNVHKYCIKSNILKSYLNIKSIPSIIKNIRKFGGLDFFLLKTNNILLSRKCVEIKNSILSKTKLLKLRKK